MASICMWVSLCALGKYPEKFDEQWGQPMKGNWN
jgi:hypothetical protein